MAGNTKVLLGGKLMFPTEYVAAIEFRGKDVSLTIAGIKKEQLQIRGGKKEEKPVLLFKETKKKLVLNKTNASTIADMYGTAAEQWVGKKVTLYPTRTQCGRDTVDCIRIRDSRPKAETAPHEFEEPEPRADEESDDVFGQQPAQTIDESTSNAPPEQETPADPPADELPDFKDWDAFYGAMESLAVEAGITPVNFGKAMDKLRLGDAGIDKKSVGPAARSAAYVAAKVGQWNWATGAMA